MIVASKREKAAYYLYLIPAFVCFGIFIFWPTIQSFYLSLCKYSMSTIHKDPKFVGLRYYEQLFLTTSQHKFLITLKNTAVFTFFTVPVAMALGLFLAMMVHSKLIKRKSFYKVALYIPYVSSMVAVASVFRLLFNPAESGVVNQLLAKVGLHAIPFLSDGGWAMFTVILMSIWKSLGYIMIIYLGGLCGISDDIYEAADLDAVTPWKKLTKITFPLLKPTTFFLVATETISSFQVFTPVNVLTGGGPGYSTTTLISYLYDEGIKGGNMGKGSAIAVIIFVILSILTVIQKKLTDED